MKDWATPVSEWELVKPKGESEWTEEFARLKSVARSERVYVSAWGEINEYGQDNAPNLSLTKGDNSWSPGFTEWTMWYWAEKDVLWIMNNQYNNLISSDPDGYITKAQNYVSQNYDKMRLGRTNEELDKI